MGRRVWKRTAILAMVALAVPMLVAESAAAIGPPAITVTPNAGLSTAPAGQSVNVSGTGFTPNSSVFVFQCHNFGSTCDYPAFVEAHADATGAFGGASPNPSVSLLVHAVFNGYAFFGAPTTTPADCGTGTGCEVLAAQAGGSARAAISFAPAPPPPPPAIVVSPNSGLPSVATVNVSGTDFTPNSTVFVFQCANATDGLGHSACDANAHRVPATTNALGAFGPVSLTVHRVMVSNTLATGTFDCQVVGCFVVADQGAGVTATGPLSFLSVPTSKDACKKDGWRSLYDNLGQPFKNQGDCVSFVATGGTNPAGG
jgi:hypothetical protein